MLKFGWEVTADQYGVIIRGGEMQIFMTAKDAYSLMSKISLALFDYHTLTGKTIDNPECK